MPRGKPTLKPSIPPMNAGPTTDPAPLIMLQPQGASIQFNAYGLEIPEIVDALRLAIVHLLSKQAGVTMFDEIINRQQRIAVGKAPSIEPSASGKTAPKVAAKSKQPIRRSPAAIYRDDGSDDEPDLADPDLVDVLNEIHKEWS